jgi:hypothetical protein
MASEAVISTGCDPERTLRLTGTPTATRMSLAYAAGVPSGHEGLTGGTRGMPPLRRPHAAARQRRKRVAGTRTGGIGLGGILVILGIVLIIVWSFWWGLIIGLIGLVFFGGFAKGKWY